jgi:GDPmannose 4,6-dehydratase
MAATRALIIGIAGQDGSYLAELLLTEGYEVHGVVRDPASGPFENLAHLSDRLALVEADVRHVASLSSVLASCRPQEVYNLAGASFVPDSWQRPVPAAELGVVGTTALLEAIRSVDESIRFFQASSSEIFGEPREVPQDEETPLTPVTPYGVVKAYGHFITRSYRSRYGLHASSGILYNHESPRRAPHFVPRKIAHAAAAISLGLETELRLGNLEARRDWGFARDYVRAMWLALQQAEGGEYVIASGESHSVRELAAAAFSYVGLDYEEHVRVDDSLTRGSAELYDLVGDATRARERLGWAPTVDFDGLVQLLVDADLERLRAQLELAESAPG